MYKFIDVSAGSGLVDMVAVKNSGIDGVIIRIGYGSDASQIDSMFEQNYQNAVAAGLKVGGYWFMYARSNEDAIAEANACNTAIQGKQFPAGIYYDYEEDTISYMDRCGGSKEDMTGRIVAFIQQMNSSGWNNVGWYANPSCIAGKNGAAALDKSRLQPYKLWLACYAESYKDAPITELDGLTLVGHQWMDGNSWDVQGVNVADMNWFFDNVFDNKASQPQESPVDTSDVSKSDENTSEPINYCVYANNHWMPTVNGHNPDDNENGYAGKDNFPVQCIAAQAEGEVINIQVHLRDEDRWLDAVDYFDISDGQDGGYGGSIGKPIDAFMIWSNSGKEIKYQCSTVEHGLYDEVNGTQHDSENRDTGYAGEFGETINKVIVYWA